MATEEGFCWERWNLEKRKEEKRRKAWGSEAGEKEGDRRHVAVGAKWESVEIRIEEKSGSYSCMRVPRPPLPLSHSSSFFPSIIPINPK